MAKLIFRIITLPFWMILTGIGLFYQWLLINKNYLLYGGEAISYTKSTQKKMIGDVYLRVDQFFKEKGANNE